MREIITQRILGGETREQIVASFVVQYGEIVLAAPTKEGFNLTVWVLPFAGIAVGCGVIAILIVRWTRRRRESIIPEDAQEIQDDTPDEYVKIFDRELEEFDQ
jgi:cytochrome c-type biogenesis protein CcmH